MRYAKPNTPGSKVQYRTRYDNFIGGEYVRPKQERYFENISPVTGKPFGAAGEDPADARPVALVAGGVSSAPLLLLGRRLLAEGVRFDFFYGGSGAVDLARRETFAELAAASGGELVATTEDGSAGERGLVTAPLGERLAAGRYRKIFSCGPMGLMKRLAEMSREHGVAGEAALETPMGCGLGACLGCAVELTDGRFALCCKVWPVFASDEVKW